MAQAITPIVTHRQIHDVRLDVDGERIIIQHSEGTAPDDAYQPHRQLTDTIEGEAFAALCNTVVTIRGEHQTYDTTLYELLKGKFYGVLPA